MVLGKSFGGANDNCPKFQHRPTRLVHSAKHQGQLERQLKNHCKPKSDFHSKEKVTEKQASSTTKPSRERSIKPEGKAKHVSQFFSDRVSVSFLLSFECCLRAVWCKFSPFVVRVDSLLQTQSPCFLECTSHKRKTIWFDFLSIIGSFKLQVETWVAHRASLQHGCSHTGRETQEGRAFS